MNSVPQRKRPRSYWNWPTSDLPRASLFESESYFLLGPVGTLTSGVAVGVCVSVVSNSPGNLTSLTIRAQSLTSLTIPHSATGVRTRVL